MSEPVSTQGISNSWDAVEMLGAYNDVIAALRQRGQRARDDEPRKIAAAIVDAAASVRWNETAGLRDRRILATEAMSQYLEQIKGEADAQP